MPSRSAQHHQEVGVVGLQFQSFLKISDGLLLLFKFRGDLSTLEVGLRIIGTQFEQLRVELDGIFEQLLSNLLHFRHCPDLFQSHTGQHLVDRVACPLVVGCCPLAGLLFLFQSLIGELSGGNGLRRLPQADGSSKQQCRRDGR